MWYTLFVLVCHGGNSVLSMYAGLLIVETVYMIFLDVLVIWISSLYNVEVWQMPHHWMVLILQK